MPGKRGGGRAPVVGTGSAGSAGREHAASSCCHPPAAPAWRRVSLGLWARGCVASGRLGRRKYLPNQGRGFPPPLPRPRRTARGARGWSTRHPGTHRRKNRSAVGERAGPHPRKRRSHLSGPSGRGGTTGVRSRPAPPRVAGRSTRGRIRCFPAAVRLSGRSARTRSGLSAHAVGGRQTNGASPAVVPGRLSEGRRQANPTYDRHGGGSDGALTPQLFNASGWPDLPRWDSAPPGRFHRAVPKAVPAAVGLRGLLLHALHVLLLLPSPVPSSPEASSCVRG